MSLLGQTLKCFITVRLLWLQVTEILFKFKPAKVPKEILSVHRAGKDPRTALRNKEKTASKTQGVGNQTQS